MNYYGKRQFPQPPKLVPVAKPAPAPAAKPAPAPVAKPAPAPAAKPAAVAPDALADLTKRVAALEARRAR
jgi:hypothetical protein